MTKFINKVINSYRQAIPRAEREKARLNGHQQFPSSYLLKEIDRFDLWIARLRHGLKSMKELKKQSRRRKQASRQRVKHDRRQ